MTKLIVAVVATAIVGTAVYAPISATAATTDNAALQKTTVDCKAQVKSYAKYHETSWYTQRKMVKKCVADATAKQ